VDDVISRWWLLAAIIFGIGEGEDRGSAEGGIGSGAWDRGSKIGEKIGSKQEKTTRKEPKKEDNIGIKSLKKKPREQKEDAIERKIG
jgi:hypothetical protein